MVTRKQFFFSSFNGFLVFSELVFIAASRFGLTTVRKLAVIAPERVP
jgi:hypothetical protein